METDFLAAIRDALAATFFGYTQWHDLAARRYDERNSLQYHRALDAP
jgi:hypothetical protein